MMSKVLQILSYVKNRIEEKSTWASVGIGVTGAAALAEPWSYVFIAVAVIGAIVPTSTKADE
jgi:hypothetical protein